MNELAETNRNIGLLETSISMQSFSAVASETQADAAEMMIRDEDSRKDAIINHLFELHTECVERMQETIELIQSANNEHDFYLQEEREALASNDIETAKICTELKSKAFSASTGYSQDFQNLRELSAQIMATIAGEQSPRVASPAITVDDLPFESAVAISAERFQQILETVDVIPTVESYMQRDIDSILSDVNEGFNSAKICICSAIGSQVWESEDLTDAEKEAFELALATQFETVAEHLEEVNAISQMPSQRRIDAVYHRA